MDRRMASDDASRLMERLGAIEERLRRIEEEVTKAKIVVLIDEEHLLSAKKAACEFLTISERQKGRWKGTLSSVEEIRKMRKHQRGY